MERFTISAALNLAEEETRKAKLAYEAQAEDYQECLNTLKGLKS